jgi:hypothetical protein
MYAARLAHASAFLGWSCPYSYIFAKQIAIPRNREDSLWTLAWHKTQFESCENLWQYSFCSRSWWEAEKAR